MNFDWEHDFEETKIRLLKDLKTHALKAAERSGLRLVDRTSNDRRTLDGEPSLRWLLRTIPEVVDIVLEEWDPTEHARVVDWARRGGKASKRRPTLSPDKLIPGRTIAQEAARLKVSTSTIARMRRAAYEGRTPLPEPKKYFTLYPLKVTS